MCMPTHSDVIGFFRTMEIFFWIYFLVVAFCLVSPRKALEMKVGFVNRMLKAHRFGGQVLITDQAVERFRRDKWILFILSIIVILLIQKI